MAQFCLCISILVATTQVHTLTALLPELPAHWPFNFISFELLLPHSSFQPYTFNELSGSEIFRDSHCQCKTVVQNMTLTDLVFSLQLPLYFSTSLNCKTLLRSLPH